MKKHFFPHDEEARNDSKMTFLRMKHGAYGYGIYWMLVEHMHQGNGEIAHLDAFAFSIGEDIDKINEVVSSCLEIGLFSMGGNKCLQSPRVKSQIEQREEYITKQKEFGKVGGLKKAKVLGYPKGTTKGSPSDKRKGKERKGKETTIHMSDSECVLGEFDEFVLWLNSQNILLAKKQVTPASRAKWVTRRKKYSVDELKEAFLNLKNEPGLWKIKNISGKTMAWWLRSDDYIEELQNCHIKIGKSAIYSIPQ